MVEMQCTAFSEMNERIAGCSLVTWQHLAVWFVCGDLLPLVATCCMNKLWRPGVALLQGLFDDEFVSFNAVWYVFIHAQPHSPGVKHFLFSLWSSWQGRCRPSASLKILYPIPYIPFFILTSVCADPGERLTATRTRKSPFNTFVSICFWILPSKTPAFVRSKSALPSRWGALSTPWAVLPRKSHGLSGAGNGPRCGLWPRRCCAPS